MFCGCSRQSQKSQKTVEVTLYFALKTCRMIPSSHFLTGHNFHVTPSPARGGTLGHPHLRPPGREPSVASRRPDPARLHTGACAPASRCQGKPSCLCGDAKLRPPLIDRRGQVQVPAKEAYKPDPGIFTPRSFSVHICPSKPESFLQSLLLRTKLVSPVKS